jgi:hypothetical protein
MSYSQVVYSRREGYVTLFPKVRDIPAKRLARPTTQAALLGRLFFFFCSLLWQQQQQQRLLFSQLRLIVVFIRLSFYSSLDFLFLLPKRNLYVLHVINQCIGCATKEWEREIETVYLRSFAGLCELFCASIIDEALLTCAFYYSLL